LFIRLPGPYLAFGRLKPLAGIGMCRDIITLLFVGKCCG
jgi:hypothetical protein